MRLGWLAIVLSLCGCLSPHCELEQRRLQLQADGIKAYRRGGYREARQHFEAALQLRPNDADLLYNLGRTAEQLNQLQEAEELYRQAIVEHPDHAAARHARTQLLTRTGRREQAELEVQAWLVDRPQSAAAYAEDGWLRLQDGDIDKARGRFQQALDRDPKNIRALNELGRIYERLDYPGRAADLYRRSLAHQPDQPEIRERLNALEKAGPLRAQPD
ncbi:MAG: tetratricopeptide repeat protein [Gemmataceae bacterium]